MYSSFGFGLSLGQLSRIFLNDAGLSPLESVSTSNITRFRESYPNASALHQTHRCFRCANLRKQVSIRCVSKWHQPHYYLIDNPDWGFDYSTYAYAGLSIRTGSPSLTNALIAYNDAPQLPFSTCFAEVCRHPPCTPHPAIQFLLSPSSPHHAFACACTLVIP